MEALRTVYPAILLLVLPVLSSYLSDPHLGLRFISHPFLWQSVSNKHPHISTSQLHCEHYFLFVRYELNDEYANDDTLGTCISHRYKLFPCGMQLSRCTAPFVVDFQIFLMFIFPDPTVLKTCLLIPLWTKIHTSA